MRRQVRFAAVCVGTALLAAGCGQASRSEGATTSSSQPTVEASLSPGRDWRALPCSMPAGLRAMSTDPATHNTWILTSGVDGLSLTELGEDATSPMLTTRLEIPRDHVSELGVSARAGTVWLALGRRVARYVEPTGGTEAWPLPAWASTAMGASSVTPRSDGTAVVRVRGLTTLIALDPATGKWTRGGAAVGSAIADLSATPVAGTDSHGRIYGWSSVRGGVTVTRTDPASGVVTSHLFAFRPLLPESTDGKAPIGGGLVGPAFVDARVQGLVVDGRDHVVVITGADGSAGAYSCAYALVGG
jgi:hypothetical protein